MEARCRADQATCWLKANSTGIFWVHTVSLRQIPWSWPQGRPWLAFLRSLRGRSAGFISSPPWLLFSLHWRLAISTETCSCSRECGSYSLRGRVWRPPVLPPAVGHTDPTSPAQRLLIPETTQSIRGREQFQELHSNLSEQLFILFHV